MHKAKPLKAPHTSEDTFSAVFACNLHAARWTVFDSKAACTLYGKCRYADRRLCTADENWLHH